MSASPQARLCAHPAYKAVVVQSGLPWCGDDRFPGQTLALFDLWAAIRPLVSLSGGFPMSVVPDGPAAANQSPLDRIGKIRTPLVRFSFFSFTSLQG
jgi:hypothetical protein